METANSMNRILVWAFPVMTLVLAFLLTAGMSDAYAESVWNWWYTLLLPGMLAILCYLSMGKERKTKYYHLMTLPTEKKKLILGKIIYMGCLILAANILIFAGGSSGRHAADNFGSPWRRGSSDSDAYDCTVMGDTCLFVSK